MSAKTRAKSPGGGGASSYVATGGYTGNGLATQGIVGVGFQPRMIWIYPRLANNQVFATKSAQDGLLANVWDRGISVTNIYVVDMIVSLNADGFTVGDGTGAGNFLNVNGRNYTYICWR